MPLSLEQLTPDVTKAAYLERMLDKNAASYKHYWLRAIVEELAEGHREMSFTALVARMVASAWYPVVYFHLSLGASDKLAELIATRGSGAPRAVIESYLAIDPHVLEYEDSPASRQRFAENLQRTITPLYQIALNQGYAVWSA